MTDLILVPTPKEQQQLQPILAASGRTTDWAFQLCGFGPIAAAARTAALISRYKPQRVLLIGIAGSFETDRHPVGSACRFDQVACHGVGVGSGKEYEGAEAMGWPQFSGGDARPRVRDVIPLTSSFVQDVPCHGQLLTGCSCSANFAEAAERQRLFPDAVAEDMEGFGVAMACSLAGVPLQIIRGISNRVGDRDVENWEMDAALQAAADMALRIIAWRWIPTES